MESVPTSSMFTSALRKTTLAGVRPKDSLSTRVSVSTCLSSYVPSWGRNSSTLAVGVPWESEMVSVFRSKSPTAEGKKKFNQNDKALASMCNAARTSDFVHALEFLPLHIRN